MGARLRNSISAVRIGGILTFTYEKQKQESKSSVQKNNIEKPTTSPNLTRIPDAMKMRFENISGFSFDDVRVHYNSYRPVQLQALAYTQGNQVYVAPGQEKYLMHELGHVVQQKQGRVYPTMQLLGMNLNDDKNLEREADMLGQKTVNIISSERISNSSAANTELFQRQVIQCAFTAQGNAARNRVRAITGENFTTDPYGGATFGAWHPALNRIGFNVLIRNHVILNAPHDAIGPVPWITCAYCNFEYPEHRIQVDHVQNWAAYSMQMTTAHNLADARALEVYIGCNDPQNLVVSCDSCNASKGIGNATPAWIAARRALAQNLGGF